MDLKQIIEDISCDDQTIIEIRSQLLNNIEDKKKVKELVGNLRDYIREEPNIDRKKIQELERFCMQATYLIA